MHVFPDACLFRCGNSFTALRMNTLELEPYRHEADRQKWRNRAQSQEDCVCATRVCAFEKSWRCVWVCVCVLFQVENIQTKDKLKVLYIDRVLQRLLSRHTQINNNWLMMITPWTWLPWVVSFLHTHIIALISTPLACHHSSTFQTYPLCVLFRALSILFSERQLKKSDVLNCTKDTLLYISHTLKHQKKKRNDKKTRRHVLWFVFLSLFLHSSYIEFLILNLWYRNDWMTCLCMCCYLPYGVWQLASCHSHAFDAWHRFFSSSWHPIYPTHY